MARGGLERGADRATRRRRAGAASPRWSARSRSRCVRLQDGRRGADRRARLARGDRLRPFARTCLPGRRSGQADDRRRPGAAAHHLQRLAQPERARGAIRSANGSPRSRSCSLLPDDLLVLPSHGEPFTGLHARLDALGRRPSRTARRASRPSRRAAPRGRLLRRPLRPRRSTTISGLATGEALAHLRHLEVTGRGVREERDGVSLVPGRRLSAA